MTNPSTCDNYTANYAALDLSQWYNYTFEMVLTGSQLVFYVYMAIGIGANLLYTKALNDTASDFLVRPWVPYCGGLSGGGQWGLTDYQEVYYTNTTMSVPQWDFQFDDTYAGSTLITSWKDLDANSPSMAWGYSEYFPHNSMGSVQIANEPFEVQFPTDYFTISPNGATPTQWGRLADVGPYCYYGFAECALSSPSPDTSYTCTLPSTFTAVVWSYSTYVPQGPDSWGVQAGPYTPSNLYYPLCIPSIPASGAYSTYIFYTAVR